MQYYGRFQLRGRAEHASSRLATPGHDSPVEMRSTWWTATAPCIRKQMQPDGKTLSGGSAEKHGRQTSGHPRPQQSAAAPSPTPSECPDPWAPAIWTAPSAAMGRGAGNCALEAADRFPEKSPLPAWHQAAAPIHPEGYSGAERGRRASGAMTSPTCSPVCWINTPEPPLRPPKHTTPTTLHFIKCCWIRIEKKCDENSHRIFCY